MMTTTLSNQFLAQRMLASGSSTLLTQIRARAAMQATKKRFTMPQTMSLLLGGLMVYKQMQQSNENQNECCGIVGYLGNRPQAGPICIQGLQILESRGYDSCGIVSICKDENDKPQWVTTKFASSDRFGGDCIKRMSVQGATKHNHNVAIGHTRWATHGDKTDINAHPHFDHGRRIALVHNGIIGNYHELKNELREQHSIVPISGTDTEVVALLIGFWLDQGKSLVDAITAATTRLEGAYSFVLISILEPDAMYVFKNTGTMVIGVSDTLRAAEGHQLQLQEQSTSAASQGPSGDGDEEKKLETHDFQIVASDTTVFQDYTKGYYNISDKEIMKLSLTDRVESTLLKQVTEEKVKIELPPGIDHYYTMEMLDQPSCVQKALNYGARLMTNKALVRLGGLEAKAESLQQVDHLILAACGTSHYATIYAEHLMKQLNCFDYIRCIKASEITEDDLRFKNPQTAAFLSVSQSGETMDLLIPFRLADKMGMQRINVVNKVNSTLARENNCGVFLNCGRELSVASTKAYISQVVVLTLVALWFSQNKCYNQTKRVRARYINELRNLSQNMEQTLQGCIEFSKRTAEVLKTSKGIMFLGQGMAEAVAQEGCLKMKELTYLNCQCFSVSNVVNNLLNYSLLNAGMPAVWVVLDSNQNDKRVTLQTMRKFMARQVNLLSIVISDCTDSETRNFLTEFCGGNESQLHYVPKSGEALSALLCVVPLQRLAFDTTIALGYNPDRPRNLAKELTTQ